MEDKLKARLLLLHHILHISVELLEIVNIRAPPWLIHGLDGIEGLMIAPLGEETLDGIDSEIVMILVAAKDAAAIIGVNFTLPAGPGVLPVIEVVLVGPGGVGGLA